jgi:Mg-chelatase subunit ChlD
VDTRGSPRYPEDEDRNACAEHFAYHVRLADKDMKGQRVSMTDFVKQAMHLLQYGYDSESNSLERDILNSQWRDNASQNGPLSNMIAMVDVSGSMEGDPMHVAIALGIRIAEKSVIGNRVLTFSSHPSWVNLEQCPDFVSKVETLQRADFGMSTNFAAALDLILEAIVANEMAPDDVQDMVLVILSDMQMDRSDRTNKSTLYNYMRKKYEETGIRVHGFPYKPPHILFWNLRSTSGFPCIASETNTSMMSGFSPSLLNVFCSEGITALQGCTPWSILQKSLEHDRYQILQNKLRECL